MAPTQDSDRERVHQLFVTLRDGVSQVVTDLTSRVEKDLERLETERRKTPPVDTLFRDWLIEFINLAGGVFTAIKKQSDPDKDKPPHGDNHHG